MAFGRGKPNSFYNPIFLQLKFFAPNKSIIHQMMSIICFWDPSNRSG